MVSAQEAIHVVIPTWRGAAHVATLLDSLAAQTLPPARVFVIDGASGDDTAAIASRYGADFIDLGANRGFAAAVNAGLALSNAPRVAVLNNDIRLAPDWLANISRSDAPFAVGKIFAWDTTSRLDATWDLVSASGVPMRAGHGQPDSAFWNEPREISLAPWTAILLRRDYIQSTGGLDESFESYLEDVDIGLRGLALGFRGQYLPGAVAWHRGSSTLGAWHPRQVRLTSRNQLRLIARHGAANWWKVLIGQGLWGLAAARHGCFNPWAQGKLEALATLRTTPSSSTTLTTLEQEIFEVGAATGFDRFWRWYWALSL